MCSLQLSACFGRAPVWKHLVNRAELPATHCTNIAAKHASVTCAVVLITRSDPAEDIPDALSSCSGSITGVGTMTGKLIRVGFGVGAALGKSDGSSEG